MKTLVHFYVFLAGIRLYNHHCDRGNMCPNWDILLTSRNSVELW